MELIGTIHDKKALFLKNVSGTAKDGVEEYELFTLQDGTPLVVSQVTGKQFSLSWSDIINLAVKAGINLP